MGARGCPSPTYQQADGLCEFREGDVRDFVRHD